MNDERLIPKPLIHKHEEYPEHEWKRIEDGGIDDMAVERNYNNGSLCELCGYTFCIHCNLDRCDKGPCVIDEYYCPNCNHLIYRKDKFCRYCGQAILQEGEAE